MFRVVGRPAQIRRRVHLIDGAIEYGKTISIALAVGDEVTADGHVDVRRVNDRDVPVPVEFECPPTLTVVRIRVIALEVGAADVCVRLAVLPVGQRLEHVAAVCGWGLVVRHVDLDQAGAAVDDVVTVEVVDQLAVVVRPIGIGGEIVKLFDKRWSREPGGLADGIEQVRRSDPIPVVDLQAKADRIAVLVARRRGGEPNRGSVAPRTRADGPNQVIAEGGLRPSSVRGCDAADEAAPAAVVEE